MGVIHLLCDIFMIRSFTIRGLGFVCARNAVSIEYYVID